MSDSIFPHIKKSVEDFVNDQEGNIPRSKVLVIGTMTLLLGILLADNVYAKHSSHSSHKSHSSHSSHSSSTGHSSFHESHVSHVSHSSHTSSTSGHSSHSSGSITHTNNTPSFHTNSSAPSILEIESIRTPAPEDMIDLKGKIGLTALANPLPDAVTNGWVQTASGSWTYVKNGTPIQSGWLSEKSNWYWFENGVASIA